MGTSKSQLIQLNLTKQIFWYLAQSEKPQTSVCYLNQLYIICQKFENSERVHVRVDFQVFTLYWSLDFSKQQLLLLKLDVIYILFVRVKKGFVFFFQWKHEKNCQRENNPLFS